MDQSSPTWFELILGPYGALFLACVGLWVFWHQVKDITKSFNKAQDDTMAMVRGMIDNIREELKNCHEAKERHYARTCFLEDQLIKLLENRNGQHGDTH